MERAQKSLMSLANINL